MVTHGPLEYFFTPLRLKPQVALFYVLVLLPAVVSRPESNLSGRNL